MNKELKKDIFLLILETIFDDNSGEIDRGNCILFYHFLIDTLNDEMLAIPEEEEADISLCHTIIYTLCNFHLIGNRVEDWNKDETLEFLKDYSGVTDKEFEKSIERFRKIYELIKSEFILG